MLCAGSKIIALAACPLYGSRRLPMHAGHVSRYFMCINFPKATVYVSEVPRQSGVALRAASTHNSGASSKL